MIYKCFRCEKLTDEKDGIITYRGNASPFVIKKITEMVFICKNCLNKEDKENFKKFRK